MHNCQAPACRRYSVGTQASVRGHARITVTALSLWHCASFDRVLVSLLQRRSIGWLFAWTYGGIREIEITLASLPLMTHLTIISNNVPNDMTDGQTWSQLLQSLFVVKFIFTFEQTISTSLALELTSVRPSFWREGKDSFVTYQCQTIRSVADRSRLKYGTLTGPYCRVMLRPVKRPHGRQDTSNLRRNKMLLIDPGDWIRSPDTDRTRP